VNAIAVEVGFGTKAPFWQSVDGFRSNPMTDKPDLRDNAGRQTLGQRPGWIPDSGIHAVADRVVEPSRRFGTVSQNTTARS